MDKLNERGYDGMESDISEKYSGMDRGFAVTVMAYVSLDIAEKIGSSHWLFGGMLQADI